MKPMLKYRGGKSRELPHILPLIPPIQGRYIEPFVGGGALFFALAPQRAIINDINQRLINFYLGVRDDFERLKHELTEIETEYSTNPQVFAQRKAAAPEERVPNDNEELYYRLRDMFNGTRAAEYSDALLYYFINKTSYSGMIRYNAAGQFNVPFGRYPSLNISSISDAHNRLLAHTEIFNTDYSDIFAMATEDDFVFLDPPYDCIFSDYGNAEYREGFNRQEHERLAAAFYALPCRAMMVISSTPLTEELYRNNIVEQYGKSYAVNIRNRFKSEAKHIIITNYPVQRRTLL